MVSNKIISVVGFKLPSDIASGRIAEMHRRICHALHDVHLAARMPRAFLNLWLTEPENRGMIGSNGNVSVLRMLSGTTETVRTKIIHIL